MSIRRSFKVDLASSAVNNGLGGNAAFYTTSYSNPINLEGDYDVAVVSYSVWNTINNISAASGTNKFYYSTTNAGAFTEITLPDGNYNVTDIAAQIAQIVTQNGHDPDKLILTGLPYLYKCQFILHYDPLDVDSYRVSFTNPNSYGLAGILGFNPGQTLTPNSTNDGIFLADNQANITNGFSAFQFQLPSIVDPRSSYGPTGQSNNILQDSFIVPPGYNQARDISFPKFIPVSQKLITQILVQITDQNGRQIDFGQSGNFQNNASTLSLLFVPR